MWKAEDTRNKDKIISYLDNENKPRFQKKDTWPWRQKDNKKLEKNAHLLEYYRSFESNFIV